MKPPSSSEEAIFSHALSLPPDERAAFLASACAGDPALRDRVESLLRMPDEAPDFMATSAADIPRLADASPGEMIGRYKLLQKIGEGGIGVVFMAEQEEPIRRRVALKVIKLGMDTKEVIARFEAERQALALMDHPNIARVIDAGATTSGRPYFVMELVRGIPITKFCDEQNLSTKARLKLFTHVCHAVQHAHQKGIIHRDLKPSNILVTLHDGVPVPKVIDFGIAKATAGRLTDNTVFTAFEQFIGTPAYMSPEQAEMSGLDIDTRSDIYSLGVLLYELLTGRTPFDPRTLVSAGLDEIRRIIREEDPPRPSTRLNTLEDLDRATIAKQRGTAPAQLSTLLRGDLDWIVMRCLEKDRTRRYETANGLALDVLRHLHDDTVTARPPSTLYRFQKLVRRNKLAVGAVVAVFTALSVGLFASIWQGKRANAEAARASEAEQVAQNEAAVAKAVNDFLNKDVLSQAGSWRQAEQGFVPNPNLTVREALARAEQRLDGQFKDQPLLEAAIRQTIGNGYRELGEPALQVRNCERAFELRRQTLGADHVATLMSMGELVGAYCNSGRIADGLALGEKALPRLEVALGANHPDTLTAMFYLAIAHKDSGRFEKALPMFEEIVRRRLITSGPNHLETLRPMIRVAELYRYAGRAAEAVTVSDETVARARKALGSDHPFTLFALGLQATHYRGVDRITEALTLAEERLTRSKAVLGPEHIETASSMRGLATLYSAVGRFAEAISLNEEAVRIRTIKDGADTTNTLHFKSDLANAYGKAGDFVRAEAVMRDVLAARQRKYGPDSVDVSGVQSLTNFLFSRGRFDDAEAVLRHDLAVREAKLPDDWRTFRIRCLLGEALSRARKFDESRSMLVAGYEGMKARQSKMGPSEVIWLQRAAEHLAVVHRALGETGRATWWKTQADAFPSPTKAASKSAAVK